MVNRALRPWADPATPWRANKKAPGIACQVLLFNPLPWWAVEASNLRPQQCECCALPLS